MSLDRGGADPGRLPAERGLAAGRAGAGARARRESPQIIVWVRAVATAMLAGVWRKLHAVDLGPARRRFRSACGSAPPALRLRRVPDRATLGVRRRADRRGRGACRARYCFAR